MSASAARPCCTWRDSWGIASQLGRDALVSRDLPSLRIAVLSLRHALGRTASAALGALG